MTVKEFIAILRQFDEDSLVVVDGYEDGVTKEFKITKNNITPDVYKKWYYGESKIDPDGKIEVVYVCRDRLSEDREF